LIDSFGVEPIGFVRYSKACRQESRRLAWLGLTSKKQLPSFRILHLMRLRATWREMNSMMPLIFVGAGTSSVVKDVDLTRSVRRSIFGSMKT